MYEKGVFYVNSHFRADGHNIFYNFQNEMQNGNSNIFS